MSNKDIIYYYQQTKEQVARLQEQMDAARMIFNRRREAFIDMRSKILTFYGLTRYKDLSQKEALTKTADEYGLTPEEIDKFLTS